MTVPVHGSRNMPDFDHLGFYRETFKAHLYRLRKGRFTLRVPRPLGGGMRRVAGTHFHFDPELFIQVGGFTDFSFPREKMRLPAGEALLIPRGLPHDEIAGKFRDDFLNVVVASTREGISIHAGVEGNRKKPIMSGVEYFKTDKGCQVEQYLDDIVGFYHAGGNEKREPEVKQLKSLLASAKPGRNSAEVPGVGAAGRKRVEEAAIQGLFQATLAALLLVVQQVKTPGQATEHLKVSECRKFILSHIYESSLSVKKLAEQLHSSPDYLSHLFVMETGERLIGYIHRERIALAKRHLQNPALNIKEIAWSCGFADQGYFTRLFKRLSGETPKSFRKKFRTTFFTGQWRPAELMR